MKQIVVDGIAYEQAPEFQVVKLNSQAAPDLESVCEFDDEGVAIVTAPHGRQVVDRPVYRVVGQISPVLPTGRIFLRFAEGMSAESRRADIETAGYRIDSIPNWAPHSAWCSHASGGIRQSLAGLDRLIRLAGVQHVEPQILVARAARGL